MRIEWLGRWPVLILYTNYFLGGFDGYCYGPIVTIRPRLREYDGVLAHELTHAAQFYDGWLVHVFKYFFNKQYRLRCEVDAYKIQLGCLRPGLTKGEMAVSLVNNYGFNITFGIAMDLLS